MISEKKYNQNYFIFILKKQEWYLAETYGNWTDGRLKWSLFIPQGIHHIQAGRFIGRIYSRDDADHGSSN